MSVLTYGTFDLFHIGHLRLLERAALLGGPLHVGLSTDQFNSLKGKQAVWNWQRRHDYLLSTGLVASVFPEETWEQKVYDIQRLRVRAFVMGDDWIGQFDFLKPFCDVLYFPRTSGISSTMLRGQTGRFE
jgi:glycerol-3-phosphate cytidylyltransferase